METPHDPNAKPGQRGYMSNYMERRPYGKPEGLADRLREHVRKLGTDKDLPWPGMGLIDDLYAAADAIDGKTSAPRTEMEFDL